MNNGDKVLRRDGVFGTVINVVDQHHAEIDWGAGGSTRVEHTADLTICRAASHGAPAE